MKGERRIGILTHHYIKNYGAFLQAYALQKTLEGLDPSASVEIINYINMKHYLVNLRPFLISKPSSKRLVDSVRIFFQNKKQLYRFNDAKKYLSLSIRCWNAEDINRLQYDSIVIGSDEVWSLDPNSFDKIKFGVGLNCQNLVSYAASVGSLAHGQLLPHFITESIKRFRMVSVRDDLTRNVISQLYNKQIERVLDPAFLIDFSNLNTSRRLRGAAYVLVYQCKMDALQVCLLKEFAKINGLVIVGAGCYEDWFDVSMMDLSPFQWVGLFNGARYIVTGTFHGVVFAIKAKKQFVACPTMPNRIQKIGSLLGSLGMMDRLIDDSSKFEICNRLDRDIDYLSIEKIIEGMQKSSLAFLKSGLFCDGDMD